LLCLRAPAEAASTLATESQVDTGHVDDSEESKKQSGCAKAETRLTDANRRRQSCRKLILTAGRKRHHTAIGQSSQHVKAASSWVPTKKLVLAPCKSTSSKQPEAVKSRSSSKESQLTKRGLSLRCRRKSRVDVDSEVTASQLAATTRVIVSDIKREPDWNAPVRRWMSTVDTDGEETVVKETIVLSSDEPPCSTCSSADCEGRDFEADARRLLKDYDGSQSVDVGELFDEHNQSEVLDHHSVIQIDDDEEWSRMPTQLASVRSLHVSLLLH